MHLAHRLPLLRISNLLSMSERTVRRYLHRFYQLGDVQPLQRRNGPNRLLGDFEQVILLRLILEKPGIYGDKSACADRPFLPEI